MTQKKDARPSSSLEQQQWKVLHGFHVRIHTYVCKNVENIIRTILKGRYVETLKRTLVQCHEKWDVGLFQRTSLKATLWAAIESVTRPPPTHKNM